jgi:hypothetical protein
MPLMERLATLGGSSNGSRISLITNVIAYKVMRNGRYGR